MNFTSFIFLFFLVVLFFLYYLTPKKGRWIVLLVASLLFYVLASWKSIFFILFTTASTYWVSLAIEKNKRKEKEWLVLHKEDAMEEKKEYKKKSKKKRKAWLTLGILAIVIVLAVMKYLNFILGNVNGILRLFQSPFRFSLVKLFLPLGISFYTFQAIGYLADIYWGKYPIEKNFFKFLLFMSFFPKIMQGPIIRYNEVYLTLLNGNEFDYDQFTDGLKRMIWGYFKKVVIANCFVVFTSYGFHHVEEISGLEAWITIIMYFIYDYCDFSGYMDIALGVSQSLGVKMPENFNHPYFAKGIDDYWRRWHMTLGTWFKDYIFYPLSISKFSMNLGKKSKKIFKKSANKIPAIFGLILVWLLTGLWHGASWNYILWGLYFGFIIILGIIFEGPFTHFYAKKGINRENTGLNIMRHIRTLILLAIGKILFETSSIHATLEFLEALFEPEYFFSFHHLQALLGFPSIIVSSVASVIVLMVDCIQERHPDTTFIQKTKNWHIVFQWAAFIGLIVCVIWFGYYGDGLPKYEFGYVRF